MRSYVAFIERDVATSLYVGHIVDFAGAHGQAAALETLKTRLLEVTRLLLEDAQGAFDGEIEIEVIEASEPMLGGNEEVVQALVKDNLRFVSAVAQRYQNRGLALNDLIEQGNAGLVTAARTFDANRGLKFRPYAFWWIRRTILSALEPHSQAGVGPLPKLPVQSAHDVARVLQNLGFIEVRQDGLHRLFRRPDRRVTTLPFQSAEAISATLLRLICSDISMSVEEFVTGL
jgi:RNA polymerase sigma factor (sigma-70 family)